MPHQRVRGQNIYMVAFSIGEMRTYTMPRDWVPCGSYSWWSVAWLILPKTSVRLSTFQARVLCCSPQPYARFPSSNGYPSMPFFSYASLISSSRVTCMRYCLWHNQRSEDVLEEQGCRNMDRLREWLSEQSVHYLYKVEELPAITTFWGVRPKACMMKCPFLLPASLTRPGFHYRIFWSINVGQLTHGMGIKNQENALTWHTLPFLTSIGPHPLLPPSPPRIHSPISRWHAHNRKCPCSIWCSPDYGHDTPNPQPAFAPPPVVETSPTVLWNALHNLHRDIAVRKDVYKLIGHFAPREWGSLENVT